MEEKKKGQARPVCKSDECEVFQETSKKYNIIKFLFLIDSYVAGFEA